MFQSLRPRLASMAHERSHPEPGTLALPSPASSRAAGWDATLQADGPSGIAETSRMLALLVEAQQALHDDPQIAWEYIEQVGSLIRLACARTADGPQLICASPAHQPPPSGGLAAWQARKVVQHIDMNLATNIKAEDLAGQANLSTGHFFRAFKTTIGETPHSYIMRQRVRRAQRLMLETNDTLSQIASACGLADQAHLTRLFKRMVGATPLVWRRCWQTEHTRVQAIGAPA